MVNPHRHSTITGKVRHEERREKRREDKTKQTTSETQWCSGITCVLAELRAHYPEHQHKERQRRKKEEDKTRQDKTCTVITTRRYAHTAHTAFPPNTDCHRYSPITQPCHKDTRLKQQYCDNEHKIEEQSRTERSPATALPHPQQTRQHKTEEERERYEGNGQCEGEGHNAKCQTQSEHGTTQHTHTPAIQQDHHANKRGTPTHRRETPTFDGEASSTTALQSPCHPPPQRHPTVHDGHTLHHDEGGAHRGYPTTRTPQTHTHHPHTTHLARNTVRHDSSTRQHCSGMSRARAAPLHWAGQQQYTPSPFRTPRRMDTIHSSIRLLQLIRVHTLNDQQ